MQTTTTGRSVVVDPHPDTDGQPSVTPQKEAQRRLVVLIPVYNDWESVALLLPALDAALAGVPGDTYCLLVDDGSTLPPPPSLTGTLRNIGGLGVLLLRRNLGHQRAIATGLCHVRDHLPCDAVLIMDGDGEDAPEDIPRLIRRSEAEAAGTVVFAERTRRSERLLFRVFYQLYRAAHYALTGIGVKVGNFSLLPWSALDQLVVVSDLWNHYAAAVFKARLPHVGVETRRACRLRGASSMNFSALVVHGLSAISVFADLAGVRLLAAFGGVTAVSLILLVATLIGRSLSGEGISMAVAAGIAVLLLVLLQAGMFALLACFITLGARHQATFIPQRDYVHFVAGTRTLHGVPR